MKSIYRFTIFSIIFSLLLIVSCASDSEKSEKPIGGIYNQETMKSLVKPPEDISYFLQQMIKIADNKANKEMMPGRVLAWSSDIAISSGILELYVEDAAAEVLKPRLIKILRMKISYQVPSPFAIDINSWNYKNFKINHDEIKGLQGIKKIDTIKSFSLKEKAALKYATQLSKTPVVLNQKLLNEMRQLFSAKR